jgi:hypothetical protein
MLFRCKQYYPELSWTFSAFFVTLCEILEAFADDVLKQRERPLI